MDLTLFIILAVILSYIIYTTFLDNSGDSFLEKRLGDLSQRESVIMQEKELERIKESLKAQALDIIKPLVNKSLDKKQNRRTIKNLLMEAGLPSGNDSIFKHMAKKIFFAIFGAFLGFFLSIILNSDPSLRLQLVLIAPIAFYKLPDFNLKRIAKKRAEEITYNLPDALDLLTVCVEAGLGLDAALLKVSQEQARTSPVLAKELGRVSKDILSGVPRQEAFRNLGERNNVPDLKSLVALLIQTDKLGTSISQSLRVYSDSVRTKRKQRVEALAAQASVKMIIPMVLFILPSMFVVILAPAVITLFRNFNHQGL